MLQEEKNTKPRLTNSDPREIQTFYKNFYEKNIKDGQYTKKPWDLALIYNLCNTSRNVTLSNHLLILLSEEMAKIYQTATVLYDVLRTVAPDSKIDNDVWFVCHHISSHKVKIPKTTLLMSLLLWHLQTKEYAKDVEENREQYEHYNILALYAVGNKPAIMELSEVVLKWT